MKKLNRTNTNLTALPPARILQFGGGNFLRAFVDWMVDELNEQTDFNGGVIIVKPTERGDYTALRQQEGLFHVVLDGIQNGQIIEDHRLVKSINSILHPYLDFEGYLATARLDTIRFVVSNTTEAGIMFNAADKFTDQPQKEFPGKLTRWLYERFKHFAGDAQQGCILLPCELIEENGTALQNCILAYARHWELEESFCNWITAHNIFCNTLVDRIVSGFPADGAAAIHSKLGFADELLAAGEYYHSWVIQAPAVVSEELPFGETILNVQFVDDLRSHREIKVRILNGAHTSMVPVGYLCGLESVRAAIEDPVVSQYVEGLLYDEVIPTLDFPKEELDAFAAAVLDRFRNPAIHHRLISIALNSTSKYKTRLLPSLISYYEKTGLLPTRICFAMAALIRFYKGEYEGKAIPLNDDPTIINFFKASWEKHQEDLPLLVKEVLKNDEIWGKHLIPSQAYRNY